MFGERLEAGDLARAELREEALIAGPEEADIRDVEEEHCDALEAQTKRPADAVGDVGGCEEVLLDDPAAEHFEPVALPEDFEFPGGACEGEVGFNPADFEGFWVCFCFAAGAGGGCFACFGEDIDHHLLQGAFEVYCDRFYLVVGVVFGLEGVSLRVNGRVGILDDDIVRGDAVHVVHDSRSRFRRVLQWLLIRPLPQHRALHLVENGVVAAVNRIPAVHVRDHGIPTLLGLGCLVVFHLLEIRLLVGAGMCSQNRLIVHIVRIRPTATRMIHGEAQDIEIISRRNDGVRLDIVPKEGGRELAFNEPPCNRKRVVLVEVQLASDQR